MTKDTEMTDLIPPREDNTQSFLIRLWQERPNQWRGTIRHVQSEAKRSFVRLDQAIAFIEQRLQVRVQPPDRVTSESPAPRFRWGDLGQRRVVMAWAAVGLVMFLALAFALSNGVPSGSLSGTAVDIPAGLEIWVAFLTGLVLGGLGMGVWFRFRK